MTRTAIPATRPHRPRTAAPLAWAAGLGLATLCAAGSGAEELACPGADVVVLSGQPALAAHVCAQAAAALARFAECHLTQLSPITIAVEDHVDPKYPRMLAHYHPGQGKVVLLSPEALTLALRPDSLLARLPLMDLHDSLLVHELAHAVLEDMGRRWRTVAPDEYIAYAMQLWSLPETSREIWTSAYDFSPPIEVEAFNEAYYMMAPNAFGAKVWVHFSTPGNGCDFVARILAGEVAFPGAEP